MTNWLEGEVVENIRWHDNLFTLKIDAEVDDFTAGQYTTLALDIDGDRIARPYSYLSSPGERPLEFFFYIASGGLLSGSLFTLEPGDGIWIKRKAKGVFTLDEVPQARDLWLIATGTGIAPFLSMLNTEVPWRRFENVVVLYGVRTESDLQYQEMMESFRQRFPRQFHYQPFVSREDVAGTRRGRIPPAIEDGELEQRFGLQLDPRWSQVMLCGNPDMIQSASNILYERGLKDNQRRSPGHITVEKYW